MNGVPVLLEHPSSLEHATSSHPSLHPEQPARITAIDRALAQRDWLGFERVSSPEADEETLLAVHPESHIDMVQRLSLIGGGKIDSETVVSRGSYTAAAHAAGGAVALVDRLLGADNRTGFSIHRPPGHHAEAARAMGFCLFNSVAVAARHAVNAHGLERVMIVDWDVHHGNGTNDIFHADPQVLFCSVHQSPLYPGTGPASDIGSGRGRGFTVNMPVAPGSGDEVFGSLVEHVIVPLAGQFAPQLVLVSAGYDAHSDDPLAECAVTEPGFAAMTRALLRAGAAVKAPLGCVLEGGYDLDALARSVVATMEVLAGDEGDDGDEGDEGDEGYEGDEGASGAATAARSVSAGVAPESERTLARLQEFWPGL
jgi:acetoin utilization deacetylase AcuC-like enzyme